LALPAGESAPGAAWYTPNYGEHPVNKGGANHAV
jgi:hypothetical protein